MNGEIVEVEGGHIVRSTGTKDRHSKVCTSKGPRDRRVRLSAPTAIQFYDVQDRLGFDRPSKAVDWLINKAKSAIDDLEKLPPWNPIDTLHQHASKSKPKRSKSKIETEQLETEQLETEHQDSSFVSASMVSTELNHSCRNYHESQDLRLSLQSFTNQTEEHALFSNQSDFDQRLMTWSNDGGGFVFASPTTSFQTVYGQSSQRSPLQSINTPMLRAWFDPNHNHHHTIDDHHHVHSAIHQSAIPGIAFASNCEFAGFRVPARFKDENNEKPLSASSDFRH